MQNVIKKTIAKKLYVYFIGLCTAVVSMMMVVISKPLDKQKDGNGNVLPENQFKLKLTLVSDWVHYSSPK